MKPGLAVYPDGNLLVAHGLLLLLLLHLRALLNIILKQFTCLYGLQTTNFRGDFFPQNETNRIIQNFAKYLKSIQNFTYKY